MENKISLKEQAEAVHNILRCKYRLFSPHQITQLEAVEDTLFSLQDLGDRLTTVYKEDADRATDEMSNQLIDLLQLQRA